MNIENKIWKKQLKKLICLTITSYSEDFVIIDIKISNNKVIEYYIPRTAIGKKVSANLISFNINSYKPDIDKLIKEYIELTKENI